MEPGEIIKYACGHCGKEFSETIDAETRPWPMWIMCPRCVTWRMGVNERINEPEDKLDKIKKMELGALLDITKPIDVKVQHNTQKSFRATIVVRFEEAPVVFTGVGEERSEALRNSLIAFWKFVKEHGGAEWIDESIKRVGG